MRYESPLGRMAAYLMAPPPPAVDATSPAPKHPAILWLVGGFPTGGCNNGGWAAARPENDQSAKAYGEAGLVMMYPTLRGMHGNPGVQESFYGEVDDVLAALDHLREVDYVDPERIYLGGHSTGATLALLAASEAGDRVTGVIAFGPVDDVAVYGDALNFDPRARRELRLRAPRNFLNSIAAPTLVVATSGGNYIPFQKLKRAGRNPSVQFVFVKGTDHWNVLAPLNTLLAERLATGGLRLTPDEARAAFGARR